MIWKPHVTVASVVEQNGRFLMVEEEAEGQLVYNQPAGHLDDDEDLISAAIRETLEETAWTFRPEAVTGIYRWRQADNARTYLRVCFTGQCSDHDPGRTLDTGIRRALWMSRDELQDMSAHLRSPMVMQCIDDYIAGRRYPLDMLIDI